MLPDAIWRPIAYPFSIIATPGQSSMSLSSATAYIALSLIVRKTCTFNKFRFYASGTGSPTVSVELQADNGLGNPSGTALDSGTITSFPTSAAWRECNNFTGYTLSPGVTYWVVIKNTSGSPSTNSLSVTFVYGMMPTWSNTGQAMVRFCKKSTTDGSTWASYVGTMAGFLFGFTDGTWAGTASSAGAYFSVTGVDRAYSGVELGAVGYVPDFACLNVVGIWGWIRRVGSPGALNLKLYSGTSLVGQCMDIPEAQTSTSATTISGFFAKNILLSPKALIRMTITAAGGNNASNYYYLSGHTCDNNYPANAPTTFKYTRLASGVFTDTDTKYPAIALLLDGDRPFVQAPLNRRQFNSMR